ncbi:unnamed protein product [Moneuplotes crassus]|uniref:Uncharacterized protein n=1 Tax=Euplotes crassus TaxID=5936 RepID=A0AAD2D7W1_EUPCR|nr:unnamed protein product [Moneuplotes crassus]CAI2384217.1 unnamed protein product [Moneuplotes crassus]
MDPEIDQVQNTAENTENTESKFDISSSKGLVDIDWDVNIVAGGKGIDRLFKRVASIKITADNNKAASGTNKRTNQVEFEIDTQSGNEMIRKLEELERVFTL